MDEKIKKRFYSLAWRGSMMFIAIVIATVIDVNSGIDIPSWAKISLGLIAGEITKYLNSQQ